MYIFDHVHIKGFRRLLDVNLKLNALNVVIGANGSGKTSLLDVFSLLAASASGRLKESISDLGGLDTNLTNLLAASSGKAGSMRNGKIMEFRLAMAVPGHSPIEYWIAITPQGVGYEISDETLTQKRNRPAPFKHIDARRADVRYFSQEGKKGLVRPNWDYNPTESALSQVPKMFQQPEDFRKRLASSTHYHVLDVGPRAPIRLPQPMRDAQLPGHDGEGLVSCLYTLRETFPDRFETIEATLRAGFPEFERLNFPPVAAGTLAMTWKERTSSSPFYMHQLSEGTLRFLWLVTLLQSPGLTAVTMIDEPEVSLHPELLSLLADLLREGSQRTQLIVATHADRLVRFLKPAEVLTMNVNEDGAAHATRADELDLDKWLEDYTLDEIWRMGRIGGRP
jgi:predicted ATPase